MTDSAGPHLYLASGSPRRRELLRQIGVRFAVLPARVAERPGTGETPQDYVQRLALDKARAGWRQLLESQLVESELPAAPVLGADTLGICPQGQILEKPADAEAAVAMWRRMSGQTHRVLTAVALVDNEREKVALSTTRVVFRDLTEPEMAAYWQTGEPRDKAGGYAIQGLGAVFVKSIEGSYSSVVGLPLECTVELLAEFGVPWWQLEQGDGHE